MAIQAEFADIWPNTEVFGSGHSFERKVNAAGTFTIKRWEAFRAKKYVDVIDENDVVWWAIGFGHGGASGVWPSQEEIRDGDLTLTMEQATAIFMADLEEEYAPGVNRAITVNVTTDMFNGCLSMAFNMGLTKWRKTLVLYNLNKAKYIAACASFVEYNKKWQVVKDLEGNPVINPETGKPLRELVKSNGLTCRRCDEASLFETKLE